jgi:DNA-binding LacI/PurR family transcriptional regulator
VTPTPERSTGAPTLLEVARAAGVSRSTVSRVMTNHPRVSPEARARVEAAVADLGYVPNRAARSLATRTTGTIALVVREDGQRVFDEPVFSGLVRGASRAAVGTARQPVLLWADAGRADETDRIRQYLVTGHVDGAVLLSVHADDPLPADLADNGVPVVISGRPPGGVDEVAWVDADNRAGARSATDHLLAAGRRRIGVLTGPADMPVARDRLAGHRDALQAAGRPATPPRTSTRSSPPPTWLRSGRSRCWRGPAGASPKTSRWSGSTTPSSPARRSRR